jgi:hypothetical protein
VKSIKLPDNGDVLIFAITLANDFTLYGSPVSLVLTAGGKSACYLVSGPINGFSGSVNLSAIGLPPGVTASFNPTASSTASILTLTASATAQPVNTNIILTGTFAGLTHNMDVNLSVITPIPGPASVNLASAFNLDGIVNDGAAFSTNGGLDGAGNAYSANLFGSAPNWNGCLFSLGSGGALDAVQCAGQTIALPAGQYTGLLILGAAVNASQPNQTFQINYADGTFVTVTQSVSVWTAAQNYAGESIAISTAYANTSGGTERLQDRAERHSAQQPQCRRPGSDPGQRADGGFAGVRLQPHRHLQRWHEFLGRIGWGGLRIFCRPTRFIANLGQRAIQVWPRQCQ